ncbi:hypothetical protein PHYSODRAFT_248938 [Phytophthora sojae]|uniref:Neutral ceramidase n=1 Tax=Phytophthora sojae (strain P6497) TaxID=1094619 RepID=G4ZWR2_PHYSP|nr:hypothetical protein PHYSODRAFT_248938 [Phytophthora sojae]EGZ12436.1 hypothetical protein PHYSODRAFT_248938 [Phytophthora sojae]|eukprot:XP_009532769.1 hypothetical protein PHYSODRAFT_248938 [Phytophthora sojae]
MHWFKSLVVLPMLAWVTLLSMGARAESNIGIGKSDITGPAAEVLMMGFSDLKESTAGILNRLYARAYFIEDPVTSSRVMFVHCNLHSVMQLVHQEVLAQLATKYNGVYTEQNVVLHATHTHAGPGGTAGYFLYDVSILGYISENFDKIVGGILDAIDQAHNSVASGTIRNTTIESAEIIGRREYDALSALINSTSELIQGSAVAKLSYVDMSNVTLDGVQATDEDPYADRTCPGIVGQNFAAGTEDGRGLGWFSEGDLKTNQFFKALGAALSTKTPQWVQDCQNSVKPVPWTPNILPVQIVKISQFAIAVTSFEVTTMAGRRIRSTVNGALADAGVTEVELATISNAYVQYMTTKEEYLVQDYEGASTLFGRNQLAAVQQELSRVAASIVDTSIELDVGPTPLKIDRDSLVTFQTGVVVDTAPSGGFSAVRTQPESSYAIGDMASCVFAGAHPKNALTLVTSFCDVEQLESDGSSYRTVMTDAHWDVRYHWERYGVAGSKNTCEWNIRAGGQTSVAGTYRFVHRGYAKSLTGTLTVYESTSGTFTVTA